MADLATLRITVDASGAIRAVDQFGNSVEKAVDDTEKLGTSAKRVGAVLGTTLVAGLALVIKNTAEAQKVQAQLAAALTSTGGAAGQTLESLNDHAAALQRITAFGDEAIGSAQALLLTFTKISGDVFPQATLAVLNLATALGGDVRGAAMQVGKALNDPILGVTALSRAGVQFSPVQKAMIAGFVETNQIAKAQGVILAELATQVEGSAAAYRNTLGGAIAGVQNAFGDLFEVSSPGMDDMVGSVNAVADALSILPTRIAIVLENLKNLRLQFSSFFDLGGESMQDRLARLEAEAQGRPAPKPGLSSAQQLERSNADLANLDRLLREQLAAVAAAQLARRTARETGARGLLGAGAGTPDPVVVTAAAEAVDKFTRNIKAMTKAVEDDTALREKQDARTKAALAKTAAAVQELSESARVFQEQTQIALGRFFSDFLTVGATSLKTFFQQFAQLGRDAIGNALAKAVMDSLGPRLKDLFSGAFTGFAGGVFGGVLGAFISGITGATNALEKMVAATNRAIADFASRPLDAQLSEEQRQLKALEKERDSLVRQALGDRGFGALEGTDFMSTRGRVTDRLAGVQSLLGMSSITGGARTALEATEKSLKAALAQIDAIGNAFDANTEAIRKNIKAMSEQRNREQADSLSRFRDSLNLSSQSPLSPTAQLAEARRQYDVILALAKAGDQSAMSSLPETARTLLDASRAVNASGVRYAQDFAKVQADTALLITGLRNTPIDIADGILDRTEPYLVDTLATANASLEVQQAGFQSVVDELIAVKTEIRVMKNALKLSLEEVAAAV